MKKIILYLLVLVSITSCQRSSTTISLVKYKGKYGFIDTKGKWYIKPTFDSLGIFFNGFADSYRGGKVGKIDSKGNLIIEHKFDFIGNYEDELTLVIVNDSTNYINLKGHLMSPVFFSDGEDFSDGLAAVKLKEDGKWGYLDSAGKIVIDLQFDYAGEFKDGKAE